MKNPLKFLSKSNNSFSNFYRNKNIFMAIIFLSIICFIVSCKAKKSNNLSSNIIVPDWSLPSSATHKQVPPPLDFHRVSKTSNKHIGIFDGQTEVGSALVAGSSSYNADSKEYTINSAGYNIWYTRDEFRFLWKKMSGDVSLAADVKFPNSVGFMDRKAVVIIRQSLDDDSEEAMVARHGGGLLHMAWTPEKNVTMLQMKVPEQSAMRIGIEKRGEYYAMFISLKGEPMHQLGNPVKLNIKAPFYVGIGFCSHIPDKMDTAILSNVVLENAAGKVK
jgi:hypothetical protein